MSQAKWIERAIFPYMVTLQAIPILAIVPLISVLGVTFQTLAGDRLRDHRPVPDHREHAVRPAVGRSWQHDLFTLHHASRITRLRKLMFPAAMPAIFAGLRISAGLSVIGAVVGDFFFRQGQPASAVLIDVYRARLATGGDVRRVILSALLGIVVFWSSAGSRTGSSVTGTSRTARSPEGAPPGVRTTPTTGHASARTTPNPRKEPSAMLKHPEAARPPARRRTRRWRHAAVTPPAAATTVAGVAPTPRPSTTTTGGGEARA
jgi:hypothetical protein